MKKNDIRKWTRPITYEKGEAIAAGGRVLSLDVISLEDGVDAISANIKGSGRNVYQAEVEIDARQGMLRDYYCECPAYDAYPSLCKHCVATLIKYIEGKDRQRRSGRTTPAMRELLQKRARIKALPVLQSDVLGKIHLTPFLKKEFSFGLEFKIGLEREYILKDVLDFADHMENQKEVSYGKQLSFIHFREAFDEESKPLVEFIMDWVKKYRDRNTKRLIGSGYYTGAAAIRTMELDEEDLEKFLLAMGNHPFYFQEKENPGQMCQVVQDKLPWRLILRRNGDGIELTVSERQSGKGKEYYFYFSEGKVYLSAVAELSRIEDFVDFMMKSTSDTVYIGKEDAPAFCRDLLPALEEFYTCEKVSFHVSDYGVIPPAYEFYLDAPNRDLVLCRAEAVYGEKRFSVFDDTPSIVRDLVGEAAVKNLVSRYGNAFDNREHSIAAAGDEELLYALLTEGVQAFRRIGKVFVSDAVKRFEIRETPRVTLGVSLSGNMLELTVSSQEMTKAEVIELLSKYQKRKKYYRLKSGDFVRMGDDGIAILQEIREELGITVSQMREQTIKIPKYRALYLDTKAKESAGQAFSYERGREFRALVRQMADAEDDIMVPASFEGVLRPYQKEGVSWLKILCRNGFGGILADDMGLGKTVQVIAFLLSEFQEAKEQENRRTLIAAPASLVFNWKNELHRFAPELAVYTVTGTASERQQQIRESGTRDILLTSYDLLRRDKEAYQGLSFFCEVIDEAQYIKNHNTKAAHAVKTVEAAFRVALTGTPMENRLSELWSIFDFLMPGFLYSYKRFREEIEVPVVQNGQEQVLKRLQKMITPFVLRRLKRDVLKDLPDKIEKNIYAPLAGEQKKLYHAHVNRVRMMLEEKNDEELRTSKIEILSELTRLRQLCCNPELVYENYKGNAEKVEMCVELIENAVQGGHKILLFSQFTSMLQILQEKLDEREITFYTITGNTGKEKRLQLVEQFNTDDTSVFCISLKAGGTGLNLTAADVVIHYDPWWNLAVQNQATDRAHRIGQKHVVTVYKLVMKDTIEENILMLQEKKKELAEQILGGENMAKATFSREELMEILC